MRWTHQLVVPSVRANPGTETRRDEMRTEILTDMVALLLLGGIVNLPYGVRLDSDSACYAFEDLRFLVWGPNVSWPQPVNMFTEDEVGLHLERIN